MRGSNSFTPTHASGSSHPSINTISTSSQPQSQTLSDLKKQRSMSRVKQHSPNHDSSTNTLVNQTTPNGANSKVASVGLVSDVLPNQSVNMNSSVTFHSQNSESPTTLLKTSSSRSSDNKKGSSRKSKAKAPTHPKSASKNVRSSSKSHQENSDNINIDSSSGNHRSSKKSSSRSSSNVKKYSAGTNEVVGPPQKKNGCCRVM